MQAASENTFIYPLLGSNLDLGVARIAGHGLGNCFYTYFHAAVLANVSRARLVTPAWFSLKLGPLLRGSASSRLYWRMFRPFAGDVAGMQKVGSLLLQRPRVNISVGGPQAPVPVAGALNLVSSERFTFSGLHEHRELIRRRLLGIVKDPVPDNHRWGGGEYIAVHVRLDDFAAVNDSGRISSGEPNLRIPMHWYVEIIRALRQRFVDRPVQLFSDGKENQLRPLLSDGVSLYRSGSDMTDLLAMAGASLLVGSNSTYSRWAAFLGNMPSIWLKTTAPLEQPTDRTTPIQHLPLDGAAQALQA